MIMLMLVKLGVTSCVMDYHTSKCIDHIGFTLCRDAQEKINILINYINLSLNKTELMTQLNCESDINCEYPLPWPNTYICQSSKLNDKCLTTKKRYEQLLKENAILTSNDKFMLNTISCEMILSFENNSQQISSFMMINLIFLMINLII